jgi:hypothetical protein
MDEFKKLQSELPIKLKIKIIGARWHINGKTYAECGFVEKYYFDQFFNLKRRIENAKKNH